MKTLSTRLSTLRRSVPFSLRLQLAAWYTIAFAALLLLTGAVFYQYLEHSLEASVDTDLQLRAQQLAGGLVLRNGTLTLRDVTAALPGFYSDMARRDLGWLWRWLPQGDLAHDPKAYLKSEGNSALVSVQG